jgi:glycosyltransferase involved in cell wall biosynthesis
MQENNINFPLISFVIPCFNDAQYIEKSVQSALNQTYPHIEVIVVDDGSNLETKRILQKLEPRITKLITQDNKGQSTARNVGIKAAKGEFIVVLDSDDFFELTFSEKAVDYFKKDATIKIVTSYYVRLMLNNKTDIFKPTGGSIKGFLKNSCATGSAMFKKSDWEKVGGYDQDMKQGFEDWEFYIRLVKEGGCAYIIKEPLLNYRIKEFSTTTKANKIKYTLLRYIYLKHEDLFKNDFELIVNHLLYWLEREELEKIKNINRIEFKIGKAILRPFRFIKSFFNK